MDRLRHLGVAGDLTAGLDDDDTTMSSAGLSLLPEVTGGDHAAIVLDPNGVDGIPEVVYVTAHSPSATTATITRGEETSTGGSVPRSHDPGTEWVHGPTVVDADGDVYVWDGSAYQLVGGRTFIGPEDPSDEGFDVVDGDQWEDTST